MKILYYVENEKHIIKLSKDNDLYAYFKNLFNEVRINDNPYDKILNDNKFIWISEDYGEYEKANRLTITELDDSYIIQFYNNPNRMFGNAKVCPICFCLSGSKNQNIANAFAMMFNNIISEKYCNKKLKKCYF